MSKQGQHRLGRMRRILTAALAIIVGVAGLPSQASAQEADQRQQLKLPFAAGQVTITADETYGGEVEHPTGGAIAFDMITDVRNAEVLAIGSGLVKIECVHKSGAAVLTFKADGYAGIFQFVHLDARTFPFWMNESWTRVEQGDVLGRLFNGSIRGLRTEKCSQISTGAHLHLDFPRVGMTLDGVKFTRQAPNDRDVLISTNGPPPGPASATCNGLAATIIGTIGHDVIEGTDGPDVIAGVQGNDLIYGLNGDDVICGGSGDDAIFGGQGFDIIFGAQGQDFIFGANGASREDHADTKGGQYFGGKGHDFIFGTNRWDRMQGGPGRDALLGYAGRDWLRGGAGGDRLDGGGAIDDLGGGPGNDDLILGTDDRANAGPGLEDRCDTSGGVPALLRACELSL